MSCPCICSYVYKNRYQARSGTSNPQVWDDLSASLLFARVDLTEDHCSVCTFIVSFVLLHLLSTTVGGQAIGGLRHHQDGRVLVGSGGSTAITNTQGTATLLSYQARRKQPKAPNLIVQDETVHYR